MSKPMPNNNAKRIDDFIGDEKWDDAQTLIRKELRKPPDDHWLITRLGETYYEQQDYKKALDFFLKSKDIVPDCPLTLWHLAGTLDALGYHSGAVRIYTWLLESKKTPKTDACWESKEWTESLKADCVFRLGLCFNHSNKKQKAEQCFRQYIALQLAKPCGSYAIEQAQRQIEDLRKPRLKEYKYELDKLLEMIGADTGQTEEYPTLSNEKIRKLQEA